MKVRACDQHRDESESDMYGRGESEGSLVGPLGAGQWSAQQTRWR